MPVFKKKIQNPVSYRKQEENSAYNLSPQDFVCTLDSIVLAKIYWYDARLSYLTLYARLTTQLLEKNYQLHTQNSKNILVLLYGSLGTYCQCAMFL